MGGLRFGVDSNGNAGYIKAGADSVTPFSSLKLIFNTGDNSDVDIPSWKSVVGKKYIISYCARTSSASGINGGTISESRYVTMWGSGNLVYQYVIEAVATKTTMSLTQSGCYGVVYEI